MLGGVISSYFVSPMPLPFNTSSVCFLAADDADDADAAAGNGAKPGAVVEGLTTTNPGLAVDGSPILKVVGTVTPAVGFTKLKEAGGATVLDTGALDGIPNEYTGMEVRGDEEAVVADKPETTPGSWNLNSG